jgi:putative hydrolase of the HAD superfamily
MSIDADRAPRYKAVIFDLFGTLVPTPRSSAMSAAHRARAALLDVPYEEFEKVWERFQPQACDVHQSELMRRCAETCGVTVSDDVVYLAVELGKAVVRPCLETPRPGSVDIISALRTDGLRVSIASNAGSDVVDAWPATPLSSVLDDVVFSAEVGLSKPDAGFYELVAQRLNVSLANSVFVGDGGSDELWGAERAGVGLVIQLEQLSVDQKDASHHKVSDWSGLKIAKLSELSSLLR